MVEQIKPNTIVGSIVADKEGINEYRKKIFLALKKDHPKLVELFQDMAHSMIDDSLFSNQGHLFYHHFELVEHSILVALHYKSGCVCSLLDQNKNICGMFTKRQQYVNYVALLIHDCGKMGEGLNPQVKSKQDIFKIDDDVIRCLSKSDHEKIGFDYIMHDIGGKQCGSCKQYIKVDGKPFNFNELLDEWNLDDNEKKIIAVLVGAHKMFTGVALLDEYELLPKQNPRKQKTFATFKNDVFELATKAGLPSEFHNKDLLAMVCVSTLADLFGLYFDTKKEDELFGYPPARRPFAKLGWLNEFPDNTELDIRVDYCKKVLYGPTKNPLDGGGALAIVDKIEKMNS